MPVKMASSLVSIVMTGWKHLLLHVSIITCSINACTKYQELISPFPKIVSMPTESRSGKRVVIQIMHGDKLISHRLAVLRTSTGSLVKHKLIVNSSKRKEIVTVSVKTTD